MNQETKNCPCCENHCPIDQLRCPRGKAHFGISDDRPAIQEPSTPEEKIILLLRKCGHFLHHNAGHGEGVDAACLLGGLSDAEKETLIALLEKVTGGME